MKINKLLLFSILGIASIILAGYIYISLTSPTILSSLFGSKKSTRDTLIIASEGDTMGFYPDIEVYEGVTTGINANIFDGLVKIDENNKVVADLAVSWQNPDLKTWRFTLQKGVTFHNGYPFTPQDVKFTFDRIQKNVDHPLNALTSAMESINVIDDNTVDIVTKNPYPSLLTALVDLRIASKKYIEEGGKEPIGTGAYKVKEYSKGNFLTLERNETYWGKKSVYKTAIFQIIPDETKRLEAFLNGSVDIAKQLPSAQYTILKENKNITLYKIPTTRVITLLFDHRVMNSAGFPGKKNPTSDLKVRKAIYYAIDETAIIHDIMNDLADPATQFVSPNIFGYNPNIKRLPYDSNKAKQLLTEAGYPNGFSIQLDCTNDRYVNDEAICKRVVEDLAKVNIKVTLNLMSKSDFFPKMFENKLSFYLIGWSEDTGDASQIFESFLRPMDEKTGAGSNNVGFYNNKEVDQIAIEASKTMDTRKRLELMQKGFLLAMEDVCWIPLHTQTLISGSKTDIAWKPLYTGDVILQEIKNK
jgi:peptide/nickel transport system substrate-binding protein